ncbi:hypothetical protein HAX54_038466 [Datura stramonium]|uniref:Disease resistance protein winged helix domain-containing protein n=1 Tax=Datura stramonium TaxID=4076 RepID=A0ABS8VL99_DATST|nr:hypothetical protein [Datura stramonium]
MYKRYLIFLDDMWDVAAWEDLMLSFPNEKDVPTGSCPPELTDSLEIAEKCKGLPLLSNYNLRLFKALPSLHGDVRGERIPVSKLISLWIAEGFVQNVNLGGVEETAEDYLNDLISSNGVMLEKDTMDKEWWIFEESSKLENLRIFKEPIGDADTVDVLLRRCPNLQELDISFKKTDNEESAEIRLKLDSFTQLQILRLSFGHGIVVSELHLPSSLRGGAKGIPIVSAISFIWGLPSLEWDASEESFPAPETLVIESGDHLEKSPSFADILTLKQIKLINCRNKSLEASAEKIKEEVEDNEGYNRIDLTIEVLLSCVLFLRIYLHPNVQTICSIQDRWANNKQLCVYPERSAHEI